MELQGRELSLRTNGDDVALLQTELTQLEFVIERQEIADQRFGTSTRAAVIEFQRRHDLDATGLVNEETATSINAEVDKLNATRGPFRVHGSVQHASGEPAVRFLVRAFDRDLRREELLGESRTDERGSYAIRYSAERFTRAEKAQADVVVRIYSVRDTLLVESSTVFNAGNDEQIDLVISRVEEQLSEYERLLETLTPVLDDLNPAEINEEDIDFLLNEFAEHDDVDAHRLNLLTQGARLARESGLPTEFFYAVGRVRDVAQPLELDFFLHMADDDVRAALTEAVDGLIVPAWLLENMQSYLLRLQSLKLEWGVFLRRRLAFRLLNEENQAPLVGYRVQAFDLLVEPEPKSLGFDTSDARGQFIVTFFGPADEAIDRHFRLHIDNPEGEEIYQTEIVVVEDQQEPITIPIPVPTVADPAAIPLLKLKETIDVNIPDDLLGFLANNNIHNLLDIRNKGGIRHLPDLARPEDDPAVQMLEAHANLTMLSTDVAQNQQLITHGYATFTAIARQARPAFVTAMTEALGVMAATQLHVKAQAETYLLNNTLVTMQVDNANGSRNELYDYYKENTPGTSEDTYLQPWKPWLSQNCSCEDCEAAVSPLAYLADLLDYTLTSVESTGDPPIDLTWLAATFHQPLGDLPASCEAVSKKIRQVRLCIEVLRSYRNLKPSDEHLPYLEKAYTTVLTKLGTSYDEIRLALTAKDDERKVLAERLAITLDPKRPDELDALFQKPELTALSEQFLEEVFGLAATNRDVLSEDTKLGDPTDQLSRWNLAGAEWNWNTDSKGSVYANLRRSGNDYYIEIYRDNAKQNLVASGQRSSPTGPLNVTEAGQSGLSGSFIINYQTDNSSIEIVAIPRFTSWRLGQLNTGWIEQDHPIDDYRIDAEIQLPVIDPDVIGPDDFRNPVQSTSVPPSNSAFDIWVARRSQVDLMLNKLEQQHQEAILIAPDNAVQIGLENFLKKSLGLGFSELDSLHHDLTQGDKAAITSASNKIVYQLHLTPESFTRLMEIKLKNENPEATEQPDKSEWRELYSILTQGDKVRNQQDWLAEEKTHSISLDPRTFWISLREPTEGLWPPLPDTLPRIDPEQNGLQDLPEQTAGKDAITLWQGRRNQLDAIYKKLQAENELSGIEAMLQLALGHPKQSDPLQHDLADLQTALESANPTEVELAVEKIENDLYMSLDSFKRLMVIKQKAMQSDPTRQPSIEEWHELYTLLTTAQKRKHVYPSWKAEEETINGVRQYWQAVKARIPRWRASVQAREAWQQALRTRSGSPIIDPDVIRVDSIRKLLKGEAYTLWKSRKQQINGWLIGFKAQPKTLDGLNAIEGSVGITGVTEIAAQRDAGENIRQRLEQLGLTTAAFDRLLRIRELLAQTPAPPPILEQEWDDVYSILTQVKKRQVFAEWRAEELATAVSVSPLQFKMPQPLPLKFPPPDPAPLPAWRATWRDQRDWENTLESRIEQVNTTIEGVKTAVSEAEEASLVTLRDWLIANTNVKVEDEAKWLTDNLLIDAKAGSCQTTTRIAQAIETVQGLLWAIKTGQLQDSYPKLALMAPNFEEEWTWIGSYATWRSAMFVFLYPENILMPNLRKRQTAAFEELVKTTGGGRRFNPDLACEAAREYAKYFEDVCTLYIQATCQTRTRLHSGNCRDRVTMGHAYLFYMFGTGRHVTLGTVYWSTYDPQAPDPDYAQTLWKPVPGMANVERIIGAAPYELGAGNRQVFLFVMTNDKKLVFSKYDLEKQTWEKEPSGELELPGEPTSCRAEIVQKVSEKIPPELAVYCDGTLYLRPLNMEGNDWAEPVNTEEDDSWIPYKILSSEAFHAVFDDGKYIHIIFSSDYKYFRLTNDQVRLRYSGYDHGTIYEGNVIIRRVKPGAGDYSFPTDLVGIFEKNNKIYYMTTAGIVLGPESSVLVADFLKGVPQDNSIQSYTDFNSLYLLPPSCGDTPSNLRQILCNRRHYNDSYLCQVKESNGLARLIPTTSVMPIVSSPFDILEQRSNTELHAQQKKISAYYHMNKTGPKSNLIYLEEAYYFVPLQLALQLQKAGHFIEALNWFRTVYNYSATNVNARKIYYGLTEEQNLPNVYDRASNWLLDPLNPHSIASSRANTYTRFTLLALIRCVLDYADAEFTQDTPESVPRARVLYETALELLATTELNQRLNGCEKLIANINIEIGDPQNQPLLHELQLQPLLDELKLMFSYIGNALELEKTVGLVEDVLASDANWETRFSEAFEIVTTATSNNATPRSLGSVVIDKREAFTQAHTALITHPLVATASQSVGDVAVNTLELSWKSPDVSEHNPFWDLEPPPDEPAPTDNFIPSPALLFCVPPNPVLMGLGLRAELNLYKIRTCRNIGGMERQLEPYAAATDTVSGLPQIGAGGQLLLPGAMTLQPTPYRYQALIERARQLIQLAVQMESAMLAAVEKRDAEYYNRLKARQDVRLSRAGVRLQQLRVREAGDGVEMAELQLERVQVQASHYQELLDEGFLPTEEMAMGYMENAAIYQYLSAGSSFVQAGLHFGRALATVGTSSDTAQGFGATASALSSLAAKASTNASIELMYANLERQMKEWTFQKQLADKDISIANQQIRLAQDHVRIVGQESNIAEMQAEHATDTMDFLANKFTNVELYDWMGDVLEGVYGFFLQQATAMAQLAAQQLAFERQEAPPPFILADYWEAPSEGLGFDNGNGKMNDRRGLTGSARLLQDLYQLDQYAFDTDKRKLQLTRTLSLSRMAPVAFQGFRKTGVLRFDTPMELFDRDFPGHYLRLVKQVRASIIALIPPSEGIRATLSTTGLSRVVIGGNGFYQPTQVKHPPDSIALTSAMNANGLFELTPQSGEMLLPFEGMGIDTSWEMRMPKASNQFDYNSIADVLLTIEYTALGSFDYRARVIQELDTDISGDRPFSFRHEFSDAWYDLHNPERTDMPMIVHLETRRNDFPPNVEDLKIKQVVLYFARKSDNMFEVPVTYLRFSEEANTGLVGGGAVSIDGIISTLRGNAGSWIKMLGKSPIGSWELALPNTAEVKNRFKEEQIEDILFVITYAGTTPNWPN